ncbi:MAG: 50S ribosomal protein L10 [Spirochaetaceae bacterium]|jgi:large subunit ribosomal protein L10|nr:50S ribosomal protein L10 [Spirochaetaceae bacterium]
MAIAAKKIQDYKAKAISEIKDIFKDEKPASLDSSKEAGKDFIFTEYRGLTVAQITELRKQLRGKNALYKVVKNNFARIAFEELSAPDVSSFLVGPTAVTVAPNDSNEVAKILFDFSKEVPALAIKGGLVSGNVYDAKQVEAFSKLPGRLELISMLMSVMNGPARNLAAALNDIPSRLVRTIKAVADKKGEAA